MGGGDGDEPPAGRLARLASRVAARWAYATRAQVLALGLFLGLFLGAGAMLVNHALHPPSPPPPAPIPFGTAVSETAVIHIEPGCAGFEQGVWYVLPGQPCRLLIPPPSPLARPPARDSP